MNSLAIPSLLILGLTAIACFWPGLSGPFVFDDLANLPRLRQFGDVRHVDSLTQYLLGGIAGPSGRTVSLLSFLINDNAWPSDPWSFKYTNLLIHLLNGCLLFWLTFRLSKTRSNQESLASWVGVVATALWLLHPLNVSTVLYVVQRMTLLAATFALAGLIAYVAGREKLSHAPRRAYLGMSVAIGLFTPLAVLSKENGALLPLLALVIEKTWFCKSPCNHLNRWWEYAFLWLPTATLVGVVAYFSGAGNGYGARLFTLTQRLLTEPTVLLDYLSHWWIPFLPTRGLFTEHYPVAQDWFDPPITMVAVMAIGALLIMSWRVRFKQPAFALGFLFFFAGHVLESTSLPLEIYFEHRNYLPAALLFLPVAKWVVERARSIRLLPIFLGVLLLGMAFTTHRLARIWGDEVQLALSWSKQNPRSSRAQNWAADILTQHGRPDLSTRLLRAAIKQIPNDVHLHIDYLVRACISHELSADELAAALDKFRRVPFEFRTFPFLETLFLTLPSEDCPTIDITTLHAILDALSSNPGAQQNGPSRQLHELRGILFVRQGLRAEALSEFRLALRFKPTVNAGLAEVAQLASAGFHAEALELLREVKLFPEAQDDGTRDWHTTINYPSEIARLQRTLEEELSR